ncbi:MAG: Ig-like domain-containing protein, partial [Actinomycetota bacterium]|nr:Ig-like domain-containing protein [Actinomycetota bacterium]
GITSAQRVRTISTAGMTPGPKTIRARVTDNGALGGADNIRRTSTATTTVLVDTPPVALPDSVRTVTGSDLPLALAGTDVDDDTLAYSITDDPDHGTLSGTGANRVYVPDAGFAGTDTFTFQVDDGYGGTSTADVDVRIDPDITGFTGPDGSRDSRAGEIEFGSSVAGATFECSLDDVAWQACTSPWGLTDLQDGEHTLRTRVTANGLTNPDVEAATWNVDAFPKIQINDGPGAESNSTGVAVDFSLAETGATVSPTSECRLDGHGWAPCLSPATFEDLDDGDHTIAIRATDAYGKQSVETVEWTIITAGSATAINTPVPATFSRATDATVNFSATGEADSFECSLDGGAWAVCSSPHQLTGLSDGTHTLRVRSIDTLGNPETQPAQISWTVDRTNPTATILTGPNGAVPAGPAAFTFKSNESLSAFECKLDGADYVACSSPFHLPADLADGNHTFRVAAIDRAGNRSLAARRDFRVLSAAPQVSLTGGPAQGQVTRSNAASFGFTTDTPVEGFECQVDGGEWEPCAAPATMTGLSDGAHSFAVRAIDEVGNRSAEPTVRDWTVDTVAPETSITEGPAAQAGVAEASFGFTSSEPGSTFECSLDGAAFAACTSPAEYDSLADGQHLFRVRATDAAGNRDTTPATRDWTIDTTVPAPPDPPLPPAEPGPCTFLIQQDRCGDPYVVAGARAPYRKKSGKGSIKVDIASGGSALGQVIARLPIGLRTKAVAGKAGRRIGRVVLTGRTRTVLPLKLPRGAKRVNLVAGKTGAGAGPNVTLKPRALIVRRLPAGTTGAKIRVNSTRGLRVITSICGTRLWRTVLTDASSNREDVDARADVTCVRKGNR